MLAPHPALALPPLVAGALSGAWPLDLAAFALASDLAFLAFLVAAEIVAALAAWLEKALDAHSRAGLVEAAEARGVPERADQILRRLPTYLLSARMVRFLSKGALVVGLASWALGDELLAGGAGATGAVPVPWASLGLVLGLAFLLNFVINDVLVGVLARRRPDPLLVSAHALLEGLRLLTAPLRVPLALLVKAIFRVAIEEAPQDTRDEVRESVSEGEREGALSPTEAGMIASIIDLPQTTVGDVLIPRAQVSMLQADTRLADAIAFVIEDGHTRLPVYGRDRDDVLGWVHARDLLVHAGKESAQTKVVREVMRAPFFVPATKSLDELLDEMRRRKIHLAIALNEIGATAGVISLEDLLEQIVGDIHDEHDVEERRAPRSEDLQRGDVALDARMRVEDANRLLKLRLPLEPEAYGTLAGLLIHRLGRVPKPGEALEVEGATLTVLEADERRVRRVRVVSRKGAPDPVTG